MIIRSIEALFTLKSNAADFRKATSEVDRFAQNANNVLGAIAGHFAFQAISGFVTKSAKAMSEVGKRACHFESSGVFDHGIKLFSDQVPVYRPLKNGL